VSGGDNDAESGSGGDATGGNSGKANSDNSAASAAAARGDGQFLGRSDVAVAEDGSITFSLNPEDEDVQQLAEEILGRLSQ
jgi:hypothetical protein